MGSRRVVCWSSGPIVRRNAAVLLFRELEDRVVDEPLEGLAALIGKLEIDRHAPGGFKIGNGEGDLFFH